MNFLLLNFVIALWIESITALLIGIFFLIKGHQKIHKLFAFQSFSVAWWSFSLIWATACSHKATAFFWNKMPYVGGTLIAAFFLHFTFSFLNITHRKKTIIFIYTTSIFFGIIPFTKFGVIDIAPKFFMNYYVIPGFGFYIGNTIFILFAIYGLILLYRKWTKSSGELKTQLKFLILCNLFGFASGCATFLPMFNMNAPFLPFLTYAGSLWPIIMAYAILRYQFLDMKLFFRKTAVYSILVTIIGVAYFVVVFTAETLFRDYVGYKSTAWTLAMLILFSLIFQPLKNIIQSFVDKYFFKSSPAILSAELDKAQDVLKRTERLKAVGTLAAGMAHEIKNPLTAIKTFAEYLPEKHNDPVFLDKFHRIVTSEVDRINSIVQQLLDFSKPKPLHMQDSDIQKIIDQTLSLLNNDIIKYKIRLIRNYDIALPSLRVDSSQMQQVFCNLFLNSIDALKEGGDLIITTRVHPHSSIAEITISDTGKGIPRKDLEHIFDPFYTTKETGTGLGMSIIYGIVKEHKGEIGVNSIEGKGTTFTIRLPL